MHKIKIVTPAGRKAYLEILKQFILNDDTIDEWILWDNCRQESDRIYINQLEQKHEKIKIVKIDNPDGTNKSVNRFYKFCDDENSFYIKLDDDVLYLPPNFGKSFYEKSLLGKDKYLWHSPLVINNAICTFLLKHHSKIEIKEEISAQASDKIAWQNPYFAQKLLEIFLKKYEQNKIEDFQTPDFDVASARFSINCIGYFGEDVIKLKDDFCPPNVDDEEYLSAILPTKTQRYGRVLGDIIICHFSFFTQEEHLINNGILEKFYKTYDLKQEAKITINKKRNFMARLKHIKEMKKFQKAIA